MSEREPGSRIHARPVAARGRTKGRRAFLALPTAAASLSVAALVLSGCNAPGRPKPGPEVPRPDQIVSFHTLYQQNCSACHGATGEDGPSYPIANPVYQALVTPAILHRIISQGDPGTSMPPFGQKYGGMLTSQQVDVLVAGIRKEWYKPAVLAGQDPPPYQSNLSGDPVRGKKAFQQNCSLCHGMPPKGASPMMDIFNPDFLNLVSDEVLRTIVIAGRPELGMPDWRGNIPNGKGLHSVLTDQEVTDIVAYLATLRTIAPVSQSGTPTPAPAAPAPTTQKPKTPKSLQAPKAAAKTPAKEVSQRAGGPLR